jgi:hypothetical protein
MNKRPRGVHRHTHYDAGKGEYTGSKVPTCCPAKSKRNKK